ncbi:MAG TPA: DMT family transporter [Alphaproteobacteria bacterium]|nr:DMT family transporter [Alphaproteobacteria bacterium]
MTNTIAGLQDQPLRAITLMVVGIFMFSIADALIKAMSGIYPTGEVVAFRNFFACGPMFFFFYRYARGSVFQTKKLFLQIFRGFIGFISMAFAFLAFKFMPLADAVSLTMSGTIFLAILSGLILKEKVCRSRWIAILLGFAGVLIITRPGASVFSGAAIFAIGSAMLFAISAVCVRYLSRTDSASTTVFYFILVCLVCSILTIPAQWIFPDSSWVRQDILILGLIGFIGGSAQIAVTQAFRIASGPIVAPFQYTDIIYSMIIGYIFWSEVPDIFLYIGALLITLSGIFIVRYEVKKRLVPKRAL